MRFVSTISLFFILAAMAGCTMSVPVVPRIPAEIESSKPVFTRTLSMSEIPDSVAPGQDRVSLDEYTGYRYVAGDMEEQAKGDLRVWLVPLDIEPVAVKDFSGRTLSINPAGFTAMLKVWNNSDHIIDLGRSLLQYEDDQGRELAVARATWLDSTFRVVNEFFDAYQTQSDPARAEYKAAIEKAIDEIDTLAESVKKENTQQLADFEKLVNNRYKVGFDRFKVRAARYNKRNVVAVDRYGKNIYRQRPYRVDVPEDSDPETMIEARRKECEEANAAIENEAESLKAEYARMLQSADRDLKKVVEAKREEWKEAIRENADVGRRIVSMSGRFNPIVIPPKKYRTIMLPGIEDTKRPPDTIWLMLYDIPVETDDAGNVLKRDSFTFTLTRERIPVITEPE